MTITKILDSPCSLLIRLSTLNTFNSFLFMLPTEMNSPILRQGATLEHALTVTNSARWLSDWERRNVYMDWVGLGGDPTLWRLQPSTTSKQESRHENDFWGLVWRRSNPVWYFCSLTMIVETSHRELCNILISTGTAHAAQHGNTMHWKDSKATQKVRKLQTMIPVYIPFYSSIIDAEIFMSLPSKHQARDATI